MGVQLSTDDERFVETILAVDRPLPTNRAQFFNAGLIAAGQPSQGGRTVPLYVQLSGQMPARVQSAVAAGDRLNGGERVAEVVSHAYALLDQATCNATVGAVPVPAAVAMARVAIQQSITKAAGNEAETARLLGCDTSNARRASGSQSQQGPPAPRLLTACADFVSRVGMSADTAPTHLECLRLLTTAGSTQLFRESELCAEGVDGLLEAIVSGPNGPALVTALLQLVASPAAVPDVPVGGMLARMPPQSTSLDDNGDSWYEWLSVGSRPSPPRLSGHVSARVLIPRRATELLALLLLHRRGPTNASLQVLRRLQDGEPVDFGRIGKALAEQAADHPVAVAVLYVLVVDHPQYLHRMLTQHPVAMEETITGILRALMESSATTSEPNAPVPAAGGWLSWLGASQAPQPSRVLPFVNAATPLSACLSFHLCATLLLILSQDAAIGTALFSTWQHAAKVAKTPAWSWVGGTVTCCGTLWLVVLCKSIIRGLALGYGEGVGMLAAALQNSSPFVRNIETAAAQRLTHALSVAMRRLSRASFEAPAPGDGTEPTPAGSPDGPAPPSRASEAGSVPMTTLSVAGQPRPTSHEEMVVMQTVVVALAEAIAGAIGVADKGNYALFYELLYHRPLLELRPNSPGVRYLKHHDGRSGTFPSAARLRDAVPSMMDFIEEALRPVREITAQVEAELASVSISYTPDKILALIRSVVERNGIVVKRPRGDATDNGADSSGPEDGGITGAATTLPLSNTLELVYQYQEQPGSTAFFLPFLWAAVLSRPLPTEGGWFAQPTDLPLLQACAAAYSAVAAC